MRKLFWGFFFIYLNFNLNLNQYSLNILPNFVGYILLLQGMKQLEDESHFFRRARPFAMGMAVYEAILWVGAVFGVVAHTMIGTILGWIFMAVSLYVSWLLIQGVLEIEQQSEKDLLGAQMYSRWKLLAGLQVTGKALGLLADLADLRVLFAVASVVVIASLVVIILYLLCWKRTAEAYETPIQSAEAEVDSESSDEEAADK